MSLMIQKYFALKPEHEDLVNIEEISNLYTQLGYTVLRKSFALCYFLFRLSCLIFLQSSILSLIFKIVFWNTFSQNKRVVQENVLSLCTRIGLLS